MDPTGNRQPENQTAGNQQPFYEKYVGDPTQWGKSKFEAQQNAPEEIDLNEPIMTTIVKRK